MIPRPLVCALAIAVLAASVSTDAAAQRSRKAKAPATSPACTDFHAQANADWLTANPLLPGTASVSAMEQLAARAQQQQVDLLTAAMQAPQNTVQKLLGDFWASGLDEASVERDGANPVGPLISRINAIRRAKDIPPSIAALHQVGIPVAFHFGADVDLADTSRHIGYFTDGGFGLPDPAFYTRTDQETRDVMARYRAYVQRILVLTGTPEAQAAAEAQWVIDLETRLAQAALPLRAQQDPRAGHALGPTAGLARQFKRLQLAQFIKAQGVTDDQVSMANPALFTLLDSLVGSLPPAQWKAYLRWRVGDAMAPYLSKAWRDAHFDFRGRVLAGQAAPAPRQQQVLDAINLAAGPMLGREYVARYLPATTRARAEEIATQVRDALVAAVDRDPRLGDAARAAARAKLAALKIEVGAPRRDLDYTVQPMGRGSFGSNMLIASTWRHREEMRRIGRGNADRRWDVLPQQPALAYDVPQNRLIVTAAVLQPPVLDMTQPLPAQYGAYGALVGHELSHAIDARGRLIGARGEARDWWAPTETAAWASLASRVAGQAASRAYPGLAGVNLNGSLVDDVLIADMAGVELAEAALRRVQPSATAVDMQAFYTAWARLWPEQVAVDAATERAATSIYPPGAWRTNLVLANQPGFAAAFTCKAGSPMAPKPEQQIRLWP
ncbi:MAG: M13-type metalloendopeptidase [Pseudomonadota bacterium]